MPAESMAYWAGFFDGEGCVTIRRSNRYRGGNPSYQCCVSVTNKDLLVLMELREEFGGKIYPKSRREKCHALAFEWFTSRRSEVEHFLSSIGPYIRVKVNQVELGRQFLALGKVKMETVAHRRLHCAKGGTAPIRKAADGEMAKREMFKQQMAKLNLRGPVCLQ
jgi:hypothetical protein